MAGLGLGNGVLRFVKQRLQGFATVPLPDTSAFLSFSASVVVELLHSPGAHQSVLATHLLCSAVMQARPFRHKKHFYPASGRASQSFGQQLVTLAPSFCLQAPTWG